MFENGKTNAMDNYSAEKLLFILSSTYIFEKGSSLNLNTLRLWQHGTFSWLEFIDNRKESDLQNIDLNKTQKLLKLSIELKKKLMVPTIVSGQKSFVNKRSENVSNGTTTLKSVRD